MCWAVKSPYVPPDPKGQLHKSLHGFWWLGEFWPKLFNLSCAVAGESRTEMEAQYHRQPWTLAQNSKSAPTFIRASSTG